MDTSTCFEWVKGFDQDHQGDSRLDKACEVWRLTLSSQRLEDDLDFEGVKPDGSAIFATLALVDVASSVKVGRAWRLICDDLNIDLDLTKYVGAGVPDEDQNWPLSVAEIKIKDALTRLASLLSLPLLRQTYRKVITEPDPEEEEGEEAQG